MENAFIVKGKIEDQRHILLDEIFTNFSGKVEVIIRPLENKFQQDNFFSVINSIESGNRSKESIDLQIIEERNSWG